MELVYFVTVLALIQFFAFGIAVGQARRTYEPDPVWAAVEAKSTRAASSERMPCP